MQVFVSSRWKRNYKELEQKTGFKQYQTDTETETGWQLLCIICKLAYFPCSDFGKLLVWCSIGFPNMYCGEKKNVANLPRLNLNLTVLLSNSMRPWLQNPFNMYVKSVVWKNSSSLVSVLFELDFCLFVSSLFGKTTYIQYKNKLTRIIIDNNTKWNKQGNNHSNTWHPNSNTRRMAYFHKIKRPKLTHRIAWNLWMSKFDGH